MDSPRTSRGHGHLDIRFLASRTVTEYTPGVCLWWQGLTQSLAHARMLGNCLHWATSQPHILVLSHTLVVISESSQSKLVSDRIFHLALRSTPHLALYLRGQLMELYSPPQQATRPPALGGFGSGNQGWKESKMVCGDIPLVPSPWCGNRQASPSPSPSPVPWAWRRTQLLPILYQPLESQQFSPCKEFLH